MSDETIAYRDALVTKGLSIDDAAAIAAKTKPTKPSQKTAKVELSAEDVKPANKKKDGKTALTKHDEKFLQASIEISKSAPTGNDMAFFHAVMCQVGLPRSKVEGSTFERRSGSASLLIEAGAIRNREGEWERQIVPYGSLPRLILTWMNTFAVRHKTPEIHVGESETQFLRMLGKNTSGGKNGGLTMFRKQMLALSACGMTLGFDFEERAYTYKGSPIGKFEAWIGDKTLRPGIITYTQEYYRTLISHAVPCDLRAMMALKGSAFAMDIYVALADRLHRIKGRPVLLHWANLREQFAQEYKGKNPDKDFRKEFLDALQKVLFVYPQAKVKQVPGGLLLLPSPPPVPYKP